MAGTVLGFDFGSYSMKIAKVQGEKVVRTVEVVLPDNILKDGAIVSYDAMADVIAEALKENKLGRGAAAVILPSRFTVLRRFEMPMMTVDQIELNLPYEFHDFLEMDKDKYFYDYLLNFTVKEDPKDVADEHLSAADTAPRMDITAAAIPKSVVKDYRDMFRRAGLKLITAVPQECAYANLLRAANVADDKESCFIQLGHSTSVVSLYKGAVFQTNRIKETGLLSVVQIIADEKNVDVHVAREYLKSNHLNVQETENVTTVYNAVAADIRKTINFYKFSNRESMIDEAYCLGGGSKIPAFREVVSATSDMKLVSLNDLLPGFSTEDLSDFALAVGACLQ